MDFTAYIDRAMEPLAADIAALCRINSVMGEAKPGMPFGEGPAAALKAALDMGEAMGFRTENFDNYVGHIETGEGEELLGIVGHLDVVPAGDGWSHDPWGGEIAGGRIWGRGTLDDKGPVLTCLHALKILRDSGVKLSRRVRMILGTNEETNWDCMAYYLKEVKPELPTVAFSPDSRFPVIYAEKAMLQFILTRELTEAIDIEGGNAFNSVPSSARITLPAAMEEALRAAIAASDEAELYDCRISGDRLTLTAKGISAHAARLYDGKNAVSYLMKLLSRLPLEGELKEVVDFYNARFGTCIYGELMDLKVSDETGPLTLNVGRIFVKDGKLHLYCDCRMPICKEIPEVEEKVKGAIAGSGYTYAVQSTEGSLYIPKDSPLVTTLMGAYQKVTGDTQRQPIASGGATYSRTIPNCVSFGCLLPEQEDLMHKADEHVELRHLRIWLEIMVEAIYRLAQ